MFDRAGASVRGMAVAAARAALPALLLAGGCNSSVPGDSRQQERSPEERIVGVDQEVRPALSSVTVELDAYSGRPNPTFVLTAAEARQLADLLVLLRDADAANLPQATLGYRGFEIRNSAGQGGIPERVYVARGGLVRVLEADGRERVLRDTGIEAWLIAAARRRGHGTVLP
jgi:hypothetical protein